MKTSRSPPGYGARLAVVLAVCMGTAACPADPRAQARTVAATVGEVEIGAGELLATLAQRGTARLADPVARGVVADVILEDIVTERLMLRAAAQAGIQVRDEDVDREVRARAEAYPPGTFQRLLVAEQLTLAEFKTRVRRRLVQDSYLHARLAQAAPVSEAELRARFDAEGRGRPRTVGEQVRARQILVRTAEEATHILERVRSRQLGFEAAAEQFSTSPDAERGGDLGWFARGDMPEVFDVCFNLEKGTISDVVISDYGFHIFQVLDRRDAHHETFEGARERLEAELVRERHDELYQRLLRELREHTPVTIHHEVVRRVVDLLPPSPPGGDGTQPLESSARALDSLPGLDPTLPVAGR